MNLIDPGETSTRYDIAAEAINASGLFEELEGKVGVRLMRAARKALGEDEEAADYEGKGNDKKKLEKKLEKGSSCLLYTSPSPRDS